MATTRSMTRNHNHDDAASTRNWIEISNTPWSDLSHQVLFFIMMKLRVLDFVSFSGVCKSWRSLALSNKTNFMASRPPMFISISPRALKDACYLIDLKGRKFKIIVPHLVGMICFGSTCGYLILFGRKERGIWLVNPITRHGLHFPDVPYTGYTFPLHIRGILVFSPSIAGWVFVMVTRIDKGIWFSVAGKGAWSHVSSTSHILDLHAFKGKIYMLNDLYNMRCLSELRLNPESNLTKLEIKNHPKTNIRWDLLSFDENLYLMEHDYKDSYTLHELDIGEMKWVSCEKTKEEYAFFLSDLRHFGAFKQKSLDDPSLRCRRYVDFEKSGTCRFFITTMWYFPHDCLNVNCLDE